MELDKFPELKRIRYTTSHPVDMTDDLIQCYAKSKKLVPFIHLPIQSGSDKILKLMNRNHTVEYYLSIYEKLKKINPEIEFSSDFIIAYPGETNKDFEDTLNLVKKVNFINSYSFIFSQRPGTPAADKKLNNLKESKLRLEKLQTLLKKNQLQKNQKLINTSCEILIENKLDKQEKYFGRTRYMTPVIFESNNCKIGEITNIKVISFNHNNLFGTHLNNNIKAA